ncbi:MAG TPA: hypothetical protein VKA16_00155, partial [Burkholderiales bacterium]|nr:hypothetical protein [Burkholderiales bacterium]
MSNAPPIQTDHRPPIVDRLKWQSALFQRFPRRMQLHEIPVDHLPCKQIRINIWRNHAFEPIADLCPPYAAFGDWQPDFRIGNYDDSLDFSNYLAADLELVWIDALRYTRKMPPAEFLAWLAERIRALRARSGAPILLATWLDDVAALVESVKSVPGVYVIDLESLARDQGLPLVDARNVAISGSVIAARLHAVIARELSCRWVPAALFPPIRAIAVDLDNTLYKG